MKILPYNFRTEEMQANLAGNKTQTRRIIHLADGSTPKDEDISRHLDGSFDKIMDFTKHYPRWVEWKPKYSVGDVLWCRETWLDGDDYSCSEHHEDPTISRWAYKADCPADQVKNLIWRPSIFMPKPACRLFLEITGVKIERVTDISEADAMAEGVEKYGNTDWYKRYGHGNDWVANARASYANLWNKINGQPSPVQKTVDGKLKTVGYISYPFDETSLKEINWKLEVNKGQDMFYRGLPLTVVVNPWVIAISYRKIDKPEGFC